MVRVTKDGEPPGKGSQTGNLHAQSGDRLQPNFNARAGVEEVTQRVANEIE
jgi:hypothetical protein